MFSLISKLLICLHVSKALSNYVEDDDPILEWPEQYSFEMTKVSLESGLIENIIYWRTIEYSRVDYNEGAVKMFASKRNETKFKYGIKYEIHPETTEKYTNKLVCTTTPGTGEDPTDLDNILPDPTEFVFKANSTLDGAVAKFVNNQSDSDSQLIVTAWAKYDELFNYWIPVRIKILSFDNWFGKMEKHEIWDINNFNTNFSEEVFNTYKYNCEPTNNTASITEELVNKNLMLATPENTGHLNHMFNAYKLKYGRHYNTEKEELRSKIIFQRNIRLIQSHNRKRLSYKMSVNKFTDRSLRDVRDMTGLIRYHKRDAGGIPFPYDKEKLVELSSSLPEELDLRMSGLVSAVKDQKDCKSSWAFGATSAAEGALALSNGGRLIHLSQQALIDCAWGFGACGCKGGSDTAAYRWMMEYGLPTEEEYGAYSNKDGFCNIKNMTKTYAIRGFTDVTPFNVEAIKVALLNHGPVTAAMDATYVLRSYSEGIFYDVECNSTKLNHQVTVVGYGQRNGEEFWIVKNSWGSAWGLDGYFHISTRDNSCGIATEPTYVVF